MGVADNWICHYKDKAPAFTLARAGYDVWVGNTRGNMYSNTHKFLDPEVQKKEYYNYTFKEIALYDIPAMIDLAIEVTKV